MNKDESIKRVEEHRQYLRAQADKAQQSLDVIVSEDLMKTYFQMATAISLLSKENKDITYDNIAEHIIHHQLGGIQNYQQTMVEKLKKIDDLDIGRRIRVSK